MVIGCGRPSQGRGLERPQSELWAVAPMGSFRAIPQLGGHLSKCSRESPTPSGDEPKTGHRGPWPQMGSFRAIPLIGGHWTKRTVDLLWRRLSTGGHLNKCEERSPNVVARLLFGTQLGLPRSDNQQTHSICFLNVGGMTSCGTRHFSGIRYFLYCWRRFFVVYTPLHQTIFQFATMEFLSENRKPSPTQSSGYEDSELSIHNAKHVA